MSTYEDELLNSPTLAPPEKLQETYQPQNLSQRDASLLSTVSKNSIINIETMISSLTQFINDMKLYKECIIDSINCEAESVDIISKYSSTPQQQPHTLPGVVATPALYNIEQTRTDNARMEELKEVSDKIEQQKQMMFSSIQADFRESTAHMKKLIYSHSTLSQLVQSINGKLNPNY